MPGGRSLKKSRVETGARGKRKVGAGGLGGRHAFGAVMGAMELPKRRKSSSFWFFWSSAILLQKFGQEGEDEGSRQNSRGARSGHHTETGNKKRPPGILPDQPLSLVVAAKEFPGQREPVRRAAERGRFGGGEERSRTCHIKASSQAALAQ